MTRADQPSTAAERVCPLTAQQLRIVKGLADGLTTKEIGREMYLAHGTVRTHVAAAMQRAGTHRQPELVALCLRQGWID